MKTRVREIDGVLQSLDLLKIQLPVARIDVRFWDGKIP
jgi:hypothetical protein